MEARRCALAVRRSGGLLSSALLIPMVGVLVAYITATLLERRRAKTVIGIVSFVAAALCLLAIASFVLDSLQTRAMVRPEMRLSFNVASITAALKTLLAGAIFLAFGVASRRGMKAGKPSRDVPLFTASRPSS